MGGFEVSRSCCAIIGSEGFEDGSEVRERISGKIKAISELGINRFVTDCGGGFSLAAAEEAAKIKSRQGGIELFVITAEQIRGELMSEAERKAFRSVLDCADSVKLVRSEDGIVSGKRLAEETVLDACGFLLTDKKGFPSDYAACKGAEIIFL